MNDSAEKHKNIVFEIKKIKTLYRCSFPGCTSKFREKGNLITHNRIHTGERPFKCTFNNCNKAFITLGNLKSHITNHTGDKPFKCEVDGCNKKYNRICRLKIHMRTHQGIKPFKCNFNGCGKSFNEKGNFKTHYRIHTGEKPFICDYKDCKMAFKAHGHLKDHKKRHFNIRPYECNICQSKFARSSTLKIHLNTHVKEKPLNWHKNKNEVPEMVERDNNLNNNAGSLSPKIPPINIINIQNPEDPNHEEKIQIRVKEIIKDHYQEHNFNHQFENSCETTNLPLIKQSSSATVNQLELHKKCSSNSSAKNTNECSGNIDQRKLLQDLIKNNTIKLDRRNMQNFHSNFTVPNKVLIQSSQPVCNNPEILGISPSSNSNINNICNNAMFNPNNQSSSFSSFNPSQQLYNHFKQYQNAMNMASPTSDQRRNLSMFYQNLQNLNYDFLVNSGQQTPQNFFSIYSLKIVNQGNYLQNNLFEATPMSHISNYNNNQITWMKGNMTPNGINNNVNNGSPGVNSPYFIQPQGTSVTFSEMVNLHKKNYNSYQ